MEIQVVKLRNGAEEAAPVVWVVMEAVKGVWNSGGIGNIKGKLSVYELNKLCKDSEHKIFSDDYAKLLADYALIDKVTHATSDSVCNVVVSAFRQGETSYDFSIGSPIAEEIDLMDVDQLVDEL